MTASDERRRILDLLDNGTITAEQAIQLLATVEDDDEPEEVAPASQNAESADQAMILESRVTSVPIAEQAVAPVVLPDPVPVPTPVAAEQAENEIPTPEDPPEPQPGRVDSPFDPGQAGWRAWWQWPFWIGIGVTVFAAGLMYLAYQGSGFGFWFACTWFPFLFGVAVMALAWASRTARWVHVRVQQKPGQKPERIAISLPIPLRLTAWALQTFGGQIPGMKNMNAAEMVMALRNVTPETPFYVQVDEGDDGEKVEVYIG